MPYALGNVQHIAGRFAVDFVSVGADGSITAGDPDSPSAAIGYAGPLFAVADAVVADVSDDINEVGSISVNGSHGPATAAGNFIILGLSALRFTNISSLKLLSLRKLTVLFVVNGYFSLIKLKISEWGMFTFFTHLHSEKRLVI
jgi:hypothetical protein